MVSSDCLQVTRMVSSDWRSLERVSSDRVANWSFALITVDLAPAGTPQLT